MYENAVPLSRSRHAAWYLDRSEFGFCRGLNAMPLLTTEFAVAALDYTVIFREERDSIMPAAVLGIRPGENLYVNKSGAWDARYIPASVRRYPFIFATPDETRSTLTLCIDETCTALNQSGRGERLFEDDQEPSKFVKQTLEFLQRYQAEFARTRAFCAKIKELNLTQPMQAQLKLETGDSIALAGFSVIDRARVKTLSSSTIKGLLDSDELELIFDHLVSLRNFSVLKDRLDALVATQH
jgi:hypothetical protein